MAEIKQFRKALMESGVTSESSYHLTDLGNAHRLVGCFGDSIKYVRGLGFLHWDGRRWAEDVTGAVARMAKQTVLDIYSDAPLLHDDSTRRELVKHARRSEDYRRIRDMIELAKTESDIAAIAGEFDQDPWLLNVQNGTIDLKISSLRPHDPQDRITKLAPDEYHADAQCPLFMRFLDRIMNGEKPLISFLQRLIGYSLAGVTSEQVLAVFWGTGANGKTTFLEAIRSMLGDYARVTPTETLMVKRTDRIPNDIARLRGARLVIAAESGFDRKLDEALIKQLTGGDTITARFMRKEYFEFKPQFQIVLGTNHKPAIRGTDHAMWRRIRLIPFQETIPDDEQDENLLEKLRGELSGILAWAINGCLDWQRYGLQPPEEVRTATASYRAEMDILADFLDECCVLEKSSSAYAKDLYGTYTAWAERTGERPLSQKKFGGALAERGFASHKSTGGRKRWSGLGLKREE